jgi:hypothetical protein
MSNPKKLIVNWYCNLHTWWNAIAILAWPLKNIYVNLKWYLLNAKPYAFNRYDIVFLLQRNPFRFNMPILILIITEHIFYKLVNQLIQCSPFQITRMVFKVNLLVSMINLSNDIYDFVANINICTTRRFQHLVWQR